MVRKLLAPKYLQDYLTSLASSDAPCIVGLIIGQPSEDKDYILHFAKTPPSIGDEYVKQNIKSLSQFPETTIAEHAKHTTRMLSGGLYVLGIFVVTDEQILQPLHKKLITILQNIHAKLGNNPLLHGNWSNSSECCILHFTSKSRQCTVKSYNIQNGTNNIVNCTFSDKEPLWCPLECKFDVNEIVPIIQGHQSTTLKSQMKTIAINLSNQLKNATFIFDGKMKNGQDTIEVNNVTKRKSIDIINTPMEDKSIDVLILMPTSFKHGSQAELIETAGMLRIIGQICSTVWLNPNSTYATAKSAVSEDIVRSFQARLSMHFDSLIEGESGIFNDTCSLHEPPRRVTIPLPSSNISLSDYLFPGEGAEEAQISFQDVLDVTVKSKLVIKDAEGQADLSSYYNESCNRDNPEKPLQQLSMDKLKKMFYIGTAVSGVLVLIISITIHFLQQYGDSS